MPNPENEKCFGDLTAEERHRFFERSGIYQPRRPDEKSISVKFDRPLFGIAEFDSLQLAALKDLVQTMQLRGLITNVAVPVSGTHNTLLPKSNAPTNLTLPVALARIDLENDGFTCHFHSTNEAAFKRLKVFMPKNIHTPPAFQAKL